MVKKILLSLILITIFHQLFLLLKHSKHSTYVVRKQINHKNDIFKTSKKSYALFFGQNVHDYFKTHDRSNVNLYIYYDKKMKRHNFFKNVMNHMYIQPLLYPVKLIRAKEYNYTLDSEEYKEVLKQKWVTKKFNGLYFYFPDFDTKKFSNFIVKYYENRIFLIPTSEELK